MFLAAGHLNLGDPVDEKSMWWNRWKTVLWCGAGSLG